MKFEWEEIFQKVNIEPKDGYSLLKVTQRAKAFGGWLVKNFMITTDNGHNTQSESMTFVPDPAHEWVIDKDKEGEV